MAGFGYYHSENRMRFRSIKVPLFYPFCSHLIYANVHGRYLRRKDFWKTCQFFLTFSTQGNLDLVALNYAAILHNGRLKFLVAVPTWHCIFKYHHEIIWIRATLLVYSILSHRVIITSLYAIIIIFFFSLFYFSDRNVLGCLQEVDRQRGDIWVPRALLVNHRCYTKIKIEAKAKHYTFICFTYVTKTIANSTIAENRGITMAPLFK